MKQLKSNKRQRSSRLCIASTALWIMDATLGIKVFSKKRIEDEGLIMDFGLLMHFMFI